MIDDDQAAALGWTPAGFDEGGNQRFELTDEIGNRVQWSIDADTGGFAEAPQYIAPELPPLPGDDRPVPVPQPGDLAAPVVTTEEPPAIPAPEIISNRGDPEEPAPDAPQPEEQAPDETPPAPPPSFLFPTPEPPPPAPVFFQPPAPVSPGIDEIINRGDPEDATPATPKIVDQIPSASPIYIAPDSPGIPPAPEVVQIAPVPVLVDITPAPAQTPRHPALTMTAADYAAQRPDLVANWERAHDPSVATDPLVKWILAFGSLDKYLENDWGAPFTVAAAPKLTAAQYAAQRPDLVVNWQRAFDPQYANDSLAKWIRAFGTVEAYLSNDYGSSFAPGAALNIPIASAAPVSTTGGNPPATVTTQGGGTATTSHRAADSTHHLVGHDKFGSPVYQLIDDVGNLVQWTEYNGQIVDTANLGSAPLGTYVPQGQTYTSGGAGSVLTTTHRAADSTHHLVGHDKFGSPVYQLIDEAGNLVQWTEYQNKMVDVVNLQGATLGIYVPQAQAYTTAALAALPNAPSPDGTVVVTTAEKGSSTLLLLGAAAIIGWAIAASRAA